MSASGTKLQREQILGSVEQFGFQNPERAAQNLARVAERVPHAVGTALSPLLADSPDPDGALNLFERLVTTHGNEIGRLFERSPSLVHYVIAIFGYSQWLGETLIQNTDLLHMLQREKSLDRSHSLEDFQESFARFRSRSFETDISTLLARFKRREYVRIMLRDVLGIATLADTTAEISALSDVLLEEAVREAAMALHNRYGSPQHRDADGRLVPTPFAVLSLGKLGGNELNYSSDIDLLYLYGDTQEEPTAALSNREYFIRLAQTVTEVLTKVTGEGAVFRIDLRLRPQGREGEPATSLRFGLKYYAEMAHDWERQALIKVRHSAGDVPLAREFIKGVQPHVYRPELNFVAIKTALVTREKIGAHRRKAKTQVTQRGLDVKLDPGGIRDIEFLVQCLQRVYGGSEAWLRSGGTLFSLQKLHDKGHISGKEFHELTTAYEFLRRAEHRLQMRRGQQTHRVPEGEAELRIIERSVGQPAGGERGPLLDVLRTRMEAVSAIYARIIYQQEARRETPGTFELRPIDTAREQSYAQILERLSGDSPVLNEIASRRSLSTPMRRNLFRFLAAAFTTSERYAAVVRHAAAAEKALEVFSSSEFLTEVLVRHPEEISTVAEIAERASDGEGAKELFSGVETPAGETLDAVFRYLGTSDMTAADKLALLRRHYRHRIFASGTRDLMQARPVFASLAELTTAADDALCAAYAIAGAPDGLAVIALGRLGTYEFDIGSDADLIFLRDESVTAEEAKVAAQRMMQALAAYTKEGTVFAVDTRLRPNGGEGELVHTAASLSAYFDTEAQAWEALTYTKVRQVAGSRAVGEAGIEAVGQRLARFAGAELAPAIREMRAKLEKSGTAENVLRNAPGGFYDVDFVIGYLAVQHKIWLEGNTRTRLHRLADTGVLSDGDCATLELGAELLRAAEHCARLVTGRGRKALPAAEHARHETERLTRRSIARELDSGLPAELARQGAAIREVFLRLLG